MASRAYQCQFPNIRRSTFRQAVCAAPLQDDARRELLQMSDQQLADVARFCNRYPDIEMEHALQGGAAAAPGDPVTVEVTLQRAQEGDAGPVDAARYIPA
jgi:pre-mRNA-splicing helicase BRR2